MGHCMDTNIISLSQDSSTPLALTGQFEEDIERCNTLLQSNAALRYKV